VRGVGVWWDGTPSPVRPGPPGGTAAAGNTASSLMNVQPLR
jgi:hypothetical protein